MRAHKQATPTVDYAPLGQHHHTAGRFELCSLTPVQRVTSTCDLLNCACHRPTATGHVYMPCELVYMLAIFSPEVGLNREMQGERIKIREYRKLETWAGHFLHRVVDSRCRGRVEYDSGHWRDVRTVTLSAGRWQLRASVRVLGIVSRVQEDYISMEGVQIAPAVYGIGTYVVLQFTDHDNMGFWERDGNLWRSLTLSEVMDLRNSRRSQVDVRSVLLV